MRRPCLFLILPFGSLLLAASAAAQAGEVVPRQLEWEKLPPLFDLGHRLPDRPRRGVDLLRDMESLLALRFEVEHETRGEPAYRCFGDLAARSRRLSGRARRAWLEAVIQRAPVLRKRAPELRELLLDDKLSKRGWDPDEDTSRDGFWIVDPWDLAAERRAPWNDLEVEASVEQGATIVWADLASFKAAENDYRDYTGDVGAAYEEIYPVPGSYVRGTDLEGNPFAALRVYSDSDLPWPYSGYQATIRVLNRIDAAGRLVTDVYSTSKDFHWLGGRDVFLPISSSDGPWVANLVVRLYGFDLDGVPDRARHRRAALRASLGNLKLKAQRIFRAAGSPPQRSVQVPDFRLLGTP